MAGLNKVMLIGNLGNDPVVRETKEGGKIANISVATSESWKDKEGNKQEQTEWHKVVFFNKLGEIAAQYLKKGSKVYVEGKMKTRKWQDKNGEERYTTEIVAESMQMLGSSGDKTENQSEARTEYKKEEKKYNYKDSSSDSFDDEIPF